MTVLVLVNIKPQSINLVGTAGRLELVDAPGFDKANPTPESLEVLATCAWVLKQDWWSHIESITWMDHITGITHNLPNTMKLPNTGRDRTDKEEK